MNAQSLPSLMPNDTRSMRIISPRRLPLFMGMFFTCHFCANSPSPNRPPRTCAPNWNGGSAAEQWPPRNAASAKWGASVFMDGCCLTAEAATRLRSSSAPLTNTNLRYLDNRSPLGGKFNVHSKTDVPPDRLAIHVQLPRNAMLAPALLDQFDDNLLARHAEVV